MNGRGNVIENEIWVTYRVANSQEALIVDDTTMHLRRRRTNSKLSLVREWLLHLQRNALGLRDLGDHVLLRLRGNRDWSSILSLLLLGWTRHHVWCWAGRRSWLARVVSAEMNGGLRWRAAGGNAFHESQPINRLSGQW